MAPPRFEHFALPGNVRLALNSNRKLKTILVKIYICANLDHGVTKRALLPMVLQRGSREFPDMQSLHRHLESLYGAGLAGNVLKVGEWHVVRFTLEVVNDRFLPEESGLFRRSLEFFRNLIYDPLIVDGGFRPDYVEHEKVNLRRAIESLVDDKATYAAHRCVEEMCRNEPFRLHEQGRIEDLDPITPSGLSAEYRSWLDGCPMAVYVAGDIDLNATREFVASVFDTPRSGSLDLWPVPPAVAVETAREAEETMEVNQGKLVLGFRHGVTYADHDYEALLVMNGILGHGSHSKLFQNVREKASMAYYAHSALERTKGLLFIYSGIAAEKYRDAVRIILEQIEAMQNGDFSEDEQNATVRTITNQNLMLEDNFSALTDVDFICGLHGRELDLEAFRKKIREVSPDAVRRVAQRLRHDTTYFLRPAG